MRIDTHRHSEYTRSHLRKNPNILREDGEFFQWMDRIDAVVKGVIDLDLLDLPDQPYHDMFNEGRDFRDVAKIVVNDHNRSMAFLFGS